MFAALVLFGGGIGELAIWIIILAAVVAIVFIATKAMGVSIPSWVIQVFWIVVIAVVCIAAIKLVISV